MRQRGGAKKKKERMYQTDRVADVTRNTRLEGIFGQHQDYARRGVVSNSGSL
jgi:hypothetical protein